MGYHQKKLYLRPNFYYITFMKLTNKFGLTVAVAAAFLFSTTGCGGEKAESHDGAATKTEEKAPETAATVVGKWSLSDVKLDLESLPAEMKAKVEDPKMKEKMEEGIKKMIAEGMVFEFMPDGVAKMTLRGKAQEDGKYELKDKTLTITDKKGPKNVQITELTGDMLAFIMEEGGLKMNMSFKKQ
jgi:hypothetical protein